MADMNRTEVTGCSREDLGGSSLLQDVPLNDEMLAAGSASFRKVPNAVNLVPCKHPPSRIPPVDGVDEHLGICLEPKSLQLREQRRCPGQRDALEPHGADVALARAVKEAPCLDSEELDDPPTGKVETQASQFRRHGVEKIVELADDDASVLDDSLQDPLFYNWRKRYGGMMPSEVRKLRQIEEENAKLKRLVADLSLDKAMLQDVLSN